MDKDQIIEQLQIQIQELLQWKQEITRQQLTFPLDQTSRNILTKDMFVWTGIIAEIPDHPPGFICTLNGKAWAVHAEDPSVYT